MADPTPKTEWETYEQMLYDYDGPPEGAGWRPLGCYGSVVHDGFRNGRYEAKGVIVWVREVSRG